MLMQDWIVLAAIMTVAVLGCAVYLLARVVRQEGDRDRDFRRGDGIGRRPVPAMGPSPEGYALNLNPFASSGPVQPMRLSRPDGLPSQNMACLPVNVVSDTTGELLSSHGSVPAAPPETRHVAQDICPPPDGSADTPEYEYMIIIETGD